MSQQALLEIQDEVNVRFLGIPSGLMETAQKELTYYVPGFMHMPAYKNTPWDGKVKLLGKTGKTYLNLVSDVIPIFEAAGFEIIIEDNRHNWDEIANGIVYPDENIFSDCSWDDGSPIVLRDYQVAAVHAALDNGQGLLEAATGSGKTVVCAAISKIYSAHGKVIVIVPNIDLVIQTQALFNRCGLAAGIWYGERKDAQDILISTWQSLDHAPELFADVVCTIVDEAHLSKAQTLSEIMSGPARNVPFRFGCTGTVPKEDIWQQQIRGIIGKTIYKLKAWQLQQMGVLASADVYQITMQDSKNPEYKKAARHFEDWSDQLNWFFECQPRVEMIASMIEDSAQDEGNALTLIPYKKHGKKLHELIDGSISVDGDVKGAKRQKVYTEFNNGDNGILFATFGVASTGIDIPRIHVLCFIEPGKKFEKIIQSVGRGLRKSSDKDYVIILDFAGDSDFAKKHATERRKLYEEAKLPCHVVNIDYINS
jgi:superfamily II DNA or RNA helicase